MLGSYGSSAHQPHSHFSTIDPSRTRSQRTILHTKPRRPQWIVWLREPASSLPISIELIPYQTASLPSFSLFSSLLRTTSSPPSMPVQASKDMQRTTPSAPYCLLCWLNMSSDSTPPGLGATVPPISQRPGPLGFTHQSFLKKQKGIRAVGNVDPPHVCCGFAETRIRDDILHHAWSFLSRITPFPLFRSRVHA